MPLPGRPNPNRMPFATMPLAKSQASHLPKSALQEEFHSLVEQALKDEARQKCVEEDSHPEMLLPEFNRRIQLGLNDPRSVPKLHTPMCLRMSALSTQMTNLPTTNEG